MGFPIPPDGKVSTRPQKCTSLYGNTCFGTPGAAVWRALRPQRVQKKVDKKNKRKAPSSLYFTPNRPDNPRRVANFKFCPLRQTSEVVNPTNFQLDPLTSFGSTGGRSWGSPINFPNDSSTSNTNVLLVILGKVGGTR